MQFVTNPTFTQCFLPEVPISSQGCKSNFIFKYYPLVNHYIFSSVSYSNSLLLILNNRYYLTIGAGTEPSSGIFKMSKTRNKSTTDFPSNLSGSGSGGQFRDKSDARIQVGLESTTATVTDTLQGSSGGYKKI